LKAKSLNTNIEIILTCAIFAIALESGNAGEGHAKTFQACMRGVRFLCMGTLMFAWTSPARTPRSSAQVVRLLFISEKVLLRKKSFVYNNSMLLWGLHLLKPRHLGTQLKLEYHFNTFKT